MLILVLSIRSILSAVVAVILFGLNIGCVEVDLVKVNSSNTKADSHSFIEKKKGKKGKESQ